MTENNINAIPVNPVKEEPQQSPEVKVDRPVPERVIGTVSNCQKLYVRKTAEKGDNVVCIIKAGTDLIIDKEKSEAEWYAVRVKHGVNRGVEGFCMKGFVKLK